MVLNASKTNTLDRCKQISQYIAHENGFGCIQNQSLDRCKQISQFIAHENGFAWMRPKPILLENGNHFTDFSANEKPIPRQMQTN
jgi:hypothetical protein